MNSTLRTLRHLALVLLGLSFGILPSFASDSPTQPSTSPTISLEKRVAALEAAFANSDPAAATVSAAGLPAPAHNTWMMVSAALVLFMTLPGLALFYGGLVRTKNVLSVMAWCLAITAIVAVFWWAFGYSLVFGTNFNSSFIGGTEFFFLRGVTSAPNPNYSFWVSQNIFAMYQMMFAIITPAVVIGAVVERMRFNAVIAFALAWMVFVYCPLAHMVWGANGFMNGLANAQAGIKAIDFAGGLVVEMASGWSALVLCLILGPRHGFGRTPMPPHSMVLCMTGTGLLWVGWYGFNAGSAVGADVVAANAFTTTTLTAAVAAGVWGLLEYIWRGKASVLGFCSGAVAGLVAVTPACGYISPGASVLLGVFGAALPFLACSKIKSFFGYDDALDVFGVHGVAGTLGMLYTGLFATTEANPNLNNHLASYVGHGLWLQQLKGMGLTLLLCATGTAAIALFLKFLIGLRATKEAELVGLDESEHGEHGYIYDSSNI